ncbi:MAG: rhodanese-like domain-containing protein [Ignavibacteria bacterium]|jgi:rhodanese-related sulfurtransferase|nr:rhodanese-like domain-containing protein [Ignavibacteria bacterium]
MQKSNKVIIRDIIIIVAVSVAIACIYNVMRPDGLPFFPKDKSLLVVNDADLFGADSAEQVDTHSFDSLSKLVDSAKTAEIEPTTDTAITPISVPDTLDLEAIKRNARRSGNECPSVTLEQMKRIVSEYGSGKFIIIDARRPENYAKSHIGDAIHIFPGDEETAVIEQILQLPKDKHIIVYCDGGACELSHDLVALLENFGYTKLFIFEGGWEEWSGS